MVPPNKIVASDLVDALLESLEALPPVELVAEGAEDPARFGLDPPEVTLHFATSTGNTSIALGARNPTRTAVYARRGGENRVYLIGLSARYYVDLLFEPGPIAREAGAARGR